MVMSPETAVTFELIVIGMASAVASNRKGAAMGSMARTSARTPCADGLPMGRDVMVHS